MGSFAQREKILIIENDEAFGDRLLKALTEAGFEAKLVRNGDHGLQSMLDWIPHLMMIDTSIGGVDGYELLKQKQAEPLLAMIPVYLLSTASDPIDMSRIPEGSVSEFFWALNADVSKVVAKLNERFKLKMNPQIDEQKAGGPARRKLLWVEDDKLIGTILSKKLTSSGFDLFHAKNGEEAIEMLRSVMPEVIVLDLVLPNMSGFDILQMIKSDPNIKDVPVMILSNLSKSSDIERAKTLGAKKFLVKAATSLDQIVEEIRALGR